MNNMLYALLAIAAIPMIRQAIKSYRAKKAVKDVIVDAIEAGVDAVDDAK